MRCPRCSKLLILEDYKGIEVDRCSQCKGIWLDYDELDQLEDTEMENDRLKGTMMYAIRASDISCPKCSGVMQTFNYRAVNLPLDVCMAQHGFWLDAGEEKKILKLMIQRIKDLKRSGIAEAEWGSTLRRLKSRSLSDRFKGLFR